MKNDPEKIKSSNADRLKAIGARIRDLRIKAGYKSHEIFAWDHEINRVQYWNIEKGSNITLKTLFKICDIHNITVEQLFHDVC